MYVGFRLKPGRDDDLIAWVINKGKYDRSYFIREALRSQLRGTIPVYMPGALPSPAPTESTTGGVEKKNSSRKENDLDAALDNWEKLV